MKKSDVVVSENDKQDTHLISAAVAGFTHPQVKLRKWPWHYLSVHTLQHQ